MSARVDHVLFLCTGNSARSLIAEAVLAQLGPPRFCAHSAGSEPKHAPHPVAIEILDALGYETKTLRSKSWDEFALPDAPELDFVFTVCANAAAESCPVWPGHPATAHWGVEDPAAFVGTPEQTRAVFVATHDALRKRIEAFLELDPAALSKDALDRRLREIGEAL